MIDLNWHELYSLGVDELDNDHKALLSIMREIKAAINIEQLSTAVSELDKLIKEASDHFTREEAYLEKVKYPGIDDHIRYHGELLQQARYLKNICEGFVSTRGVKECFDSMSRFIINDVLKGDLKFKSYLQEVGVAKTG